jgi:hypothetical protein
MELKTAPLLRNWDAISDQSKDHHGTEETAGEYPTATAGEEI